MSKEDAAHRLERQPKGLYVSTFCIMQQSILVAATGNLVYQMWAVKRRGLVRFSGNMTLSITSSLHNLSCEELFLEYSVYDLLFTGVNVKSTPTETSLWRGAAGTAYTRIPHKLYLCNVKLKFRVVMANDAAEIPQKTDTFLALCFILCFTKTWPVHFGSYIQRYFNT